MKYFSPNILDGSVTTAKLADGAVTLAKMGIASVNTPQYVDFSVTNAKLRFDAVTSGKIVTTESSQGGSLGAGASVNVSLSAFSFFPDLEANQITADLFDFRPIDTATPAADADAPEFELTNTGGLARNYDVAWRHISA